MVGVQFTFHKINKVQYQSIRIMLIGITNHYQMDESHSNLRGTRFMSLDKKCFK